MAKKKSARNVAPPPSKKKKANADMSEQGLLPLAAKGKSAKESAAPVKPLPPTKPPKKDPVIVQSRAAKTEREAKPGKRSAKGTAESMAAKQREISVSEFFAKNRHLLGFDNPGKALLTTVKEAVDNSLDACEEAHILPEIEVRITQLAEDRFRVSIEDNGPGIVKAQVPKIFGKLLYGSKFHTMKQSRGQQGIGISAAVMYSQITTGKTCKIISRTDDKKPAHFFEMRIDTAKNAPEVLEDKVVEYKHDHGTQIELEIQATYKKGRHSVDGYLQQIALANPHAEIRYYPPKVDEGDPPLIEFKRVINEMPREALEILPHPYGVELGVLLKMAQGTTSHSIQGFLTKDFSRVSNPVATEILQKAGISADMKARDITLEEAERLYKAINETKIMAPQSNCLSPIGEDLILRGMQQMVKADFYASTTRPPAVYRGNPFQIEVGMAWGGEMPADELCTLYRFANRVPLQYQQSACGITKAAMSIAWNGYGVSQSKGALPTGPMLIILHIASVWVPFTSESKEAVAHYPEILKEMRLAIQEVGRQLNVFLRRRQKEHDAFLKASYIEKYIPHIGIALKEILALNDKQEEKVVATLKDTLERSRTM